MRLMSIRCIWASVMLVANLAAVNCSGSPPQRAHTVTSSSITPAPGDFPPPVKPQWLDDGDFERLAKPFENDKAKLDALVDDLDLFVFLAASTEKSSRADVIAASVLMVKYYLHR